ncbi:MAG TPA: short-chain dehydrogenase [Firmicutes bacterium]|nr:short-chain dehydrogenase [Bacillota bacterium]
MYTGKVVVVTGAARGIGKALALAYANREASVIGIDILDFDYEHEKVEALKVDLGQPSKIDAAFTKIIKKYKTIHVLINNAAISTFHKDVFELTVEEFNTILGVNLSGAFACSKAFIHANAGQSYGRIINIASTRWYQNEAGWEAYGASKGGLVSLTHTMAVSLSDTPITVNAISPGWIQVEEYDALSETDHHQHPSGRVGKAEDILKAAFFLSDEQNDFVNGHNLLVDGGMTKKMIYE